MKLYRSVCHEPRRDIFTRSRVGEAGEADGIEARLKAEFPDFSVKRFITNYPFTNPEAADAILHAA